MLFKCSKILASLTAILIANATMLQANDLTAEVQTRLRILGETPGIIDGAFGKKTNAAINRLLETTNVQYKNQLLSVNDSLISKIVAKKSSAGSKIFETTSDFVESKNTDLQLFKDHKLFNYAQIHFDRGRGGLPSKWYQPDLNGDGLSDFVLFGVGQDHVSECGLDKCGDEWMREPIFLIRTSEKIVSGNSIEAQLKLIPNKELSDPIILNRGTGGKTIFVDFNGDGRDDFYLPSEGPVAGPNIHIGGKDILMMSTPDGGYEDVAKKYELLNANTFQHWTAAGDIDNDGDVDFIFHNIQAKTVMPDKIACFINDGSGNFTVKNCVSPPTAKGSSKFYSWGGTLFDVNGDNHLDLWLSRDARNVPIVLLGDGTGQFDEERSLEVYLPKDWPRVMKQFGYIAAADLEDDGFNEIFFSVQGVKSLSPTDCKGMKGAYCGSYVGFFNNNNGFLEFGGFLKKFDKADIYDWMGSSMIVVKDYWGNDGLKDVLLKRNFHDGASPFIIQTQVGKFETIERLNATNSLAPNNLRSVGINTRQMICANAVENGDWIEGADYWKSVATAQGFDAAICQFYADK